MPIFVGGSLMRWCQMRVRSSKMRLFSFDRYIFRSKFPTGFTYRNLHGLRGFPATARLLFNNVYNYSLIENRMVVIVSWILFRGACHVPEFCSDCKGRQLSNAKYQVSKKWIPVLPPPRRYCDSSRLLVCVCMCVRVFVKIMLGRISSKRLEIEAWLQWKPAGNGVWRIDWSRDRRRHVTRWGLMALCAPVGSFALWLLF